MTESAPPGYPIQDRGRLVIILALLASIVLLLAILFMLVSISRNGLNIRLGGDKDLSDMSDQVTVELTMDEPIVLAIPQPVQMVATGPDGEAIPATLSFVRCPSCNGSMLPSKWNPWTGQIEWTCPACGEAGPPLDTP
ncbi:hypothetical protein KAR02_06500 [Candidatus Bipolaricaulota bacterium]|nr:hypothetical protein [Candidatus Bipolaricaulota bacterium]